MPIHLVVTAERKFWRCVETGGAPALFGVEPPKPRIEAVPRSLLRSLRGSGRLIGQGRAQEPGAE
jgi:hypothetical protein